MGPASVHPSLDGGGTGAPGPEGLYRQLPVIAGGALQGADDALDGLGGHLHPLEQLGGLRGASPLLAAGGGAGLRELDMFGAHREEAAAEAGEHGRHDEKGDRRWR